MLKILNPCGFISSTCLKLAIPGLTPGPGHGLDFPILRHVSWNMSQLSKHLQEKVSLQSTWQHLPFSCSFLLECSLCSFREISVINPGVLQVWVDMLVPTQHATYVTCDIRECLLPVEWPPLTNPASSFVDRVKGVKKISCKCFKTEVLL